MLVTDLDLTTGQALEEIVARSLAGGVNVVQLRAPGLPARDLLRTAQALRHIVQPPALLIINDRVDVALASEADGVQLGERSLPVAVARGLAPTLVIGASVHGLASAQDAERDGADYLIVGTMFPSGSHPGKVPEGIGLLRSIRSQVAVPLVGIGGITSENVPEVMETGASGAAVISSIMTASDPAAAARALLDCM
jgi:thiamine-phosphate diphosphorylase